LAYEYWHKILFARFLEANNLLMHPTMGVAVTLEEIVELAPEEGYADKWDAAATYASKMLPAIFRVNDPLMQVKFSPDDRIALESILNELEPEIFTADDALGWVYQFWQNEAKAAINASGDKIDGKRLPAVTQLFTEPYMVNFLIDNTLGAWWVSRNPGVTPPYNFEYLRMHKPDTEPVEVPAAGKFEGWPDKTAEITSLDPCMGSGHFVCSLFNVFAALRMHEEGLTKEQATDRVIAENLHGLEIDPRCTQIAAFNLALTAWKFCGHYKELPEMNLACSGIAPKGKVEDWVKLVGNVPRDDKGRMENGMKALYEHFQLAPELGSLLDPTTIKADAFTASFEQLQPVLKKALENERDNEVLERGVMAAGIAKAGLILAHNYSLTITNVPYLGRLNQCEILLSFGDSRYPSSKSDLAFMMQDRCLQLLNKDGIFAGVAPQGWSFSGRYLNSRKFYLTNYNLPLIARLGSGAFITISGEIVKVNLIIIKKSLPNIHSAISLLDVTKSQTTLLKSMKLIENKITLSNQYDQKNNASHIISFELIDNKLPKLSTIGDCYQGIVTGDINRFIRNWWELKNVTNGWEFYQQAPYSDLIYEGLTNVIYWQNGSGGLHEYARLTREKLHDMHESGKLSWGKKGVAIGRITKKVSLYYGSKYDNSVAVITPFLEKDIAPVFEYCRSENFVHDLFNLDQKLSITNSTILKVPYDNRNWETQSFLSFPVGLPKPSSDDPTQWLFHGHPVKAENALQVAVARLLGYRWPAENVKAASSGFKNNTSVTTAETDGDNMELSEEAKELIRQVKELHLPFDEDGIVCIPPVYSEQPGAERLRLLLQQAWGENWSNSVVADLLKQASSNKTNLEDWLRDEFFANHCKVFHNRPFIWHIWDGRKDGFSALVNYHKLDKETLKKLIYTYLGDWIRQCEAKRKAGESGADGLLSAALKLKEKLELILVGEQPYDIFVRWKKLEEQPIGWEPDLNDGVRLNIRPIVEAGVLRSRFNIKWGIDRGKNPAGSPWGEIRDNDWHLSLEEKRKAREK